MVAPVYATTSNQTLTDFNTDMSITADSDDPSLSLSM